MTARPLALVETSCFSYPSEPDAPAHSRSVSHLSDNTHQAGSVPTCAAATRRGSRTNPGYQCWVVSTPYAELRGPSTPAVPDFATWAEQHSFCHRCPCSAPVQDPPVLQTTGRCWVCCSSAAARQGCPPAASSSPASTGACRACGKAQGLSPHHLKADCRAPSQLPTTSKTSQTPRDTSYLAGFHGLACLLGEHSGILCLGELAGAEPNHSADVLLRGLQQANHNRPNVLHRHPIHGGVPHGQCCMGEIDFTQSAAQPSTQSTGTARVFGTQPLNARGGRAKGTHQRSKSGKHLQD